jgi:hypothetical protein
MNKAMEVLSKSTEQQQLALFKECEQFSETGILPESAQMRAIVRDCGHEDTALTLMLYSTHVYRYFAQQYVRDLEISRMDTERY